VSVEVLQKAFASTARVLPGVPAGQMEEPTPCASWRVRDLVNHIVGGPFYFAATVETGAAPARAETPDFAAADFAATFDEGAERAIAAFSAPGAMDKYLELPFGKIPGSIFVFVASIDSFTHGWDLARATGQSTDLDPALAAQLLGAAQAALTDDLRGPDGRAPFGPAVEVTGPASPADELAAFMGRHP